MKKENQNDLVDEIRDVSSDIILTTLNSISESNNLGFVCIKAK